MNTEDIFKNSGLLVPNPKYDSSKKKNRESPYIHTIDATKDITPGSASANLFSSSVADSWTMGDTDKYQNYGITPNKVSSNLDKELANAQSNWKKAGNAIAQTLVSEIGIGIPLGFADLLDMIGSKVGVLDDDYKNPVSDFLEKAQEEFRNNVAPIYADSDKNITNGGLTDFGWWASNFPSVASSLTLLIPSSGITRGLSYLSKLGGAKSISAFTRNAIRATTKAIGNKNVYRWANKAGTIQKANAMTELGINAALSRTMENYQEARGVYNDMYDEASNYLNNMSDEQYNNYINSNPHIFKDENGNDKVDVSDKDAVAKFVAKEAADRDFTQNYVNMGWDVLQLYALKNMFRGGKLPELGRSKVRRANKDMTKYADKLKGKNATEIEEEIKALNDKLPFMTKVGRKLEDWTYGNAVLLGAEASEGAEEAWNYISQMEGMHTGRLLLGNEKASRWDDRAADYIQNPQLWDSAFWGVLGGVVFQGIGGTLKKVGYNYSKFQEDKENAAKAEKTGENPLKAEFRAFDDMPDVKRGVQSVYARQVALMDLKDKKALIESGKNPYNPNQDIEENQKDTFIKMVTDDFITNTALQAYNNGTFDMTREYFANDNVRKGMVENGIIDEESSHALQNEITEKLDKVKEDYETETTKLDALSSKTKRRENIPMEYIQIAASHNIRTKNNIDDMTRRQADLFKAFDEAFANVPDDKINKALPFKQMMDFQVKTSYLEKLEEDKRELEKAHNESHSISTQIALDNINKQISKVKKDIAGDFNEERAAYTMFTLNELLAHKRNKFKEIDADIENIFADLEKGDAKAFGKYFGNEEYNPDEETLGRIKKQYKELSKQYKDVDSSLEQLGNIGDDYRNAVMLGQFIQEQKNNYIATREEFDNYMNVLNNTMNEARAKAIDESIEKIVALTDKHDVETIDKILYANRNDQSIDELTSDFTEDEKSKLNEALDVINFSNQANLGLYGSIMNRITAKMLQQAQEEGTNSAVTNNAVNSSSKSTQTQPMNNSSEEQSESSESKANDENSNIQEQNPNVQSQNRYLKANKDNVEIDGINENEADGIIDDEGNVIPKNDSSEEEAKFIKNQNLFDYEEGVSLIDDNYKIEVYPKIDDSGSLTKGRIIKVTTNANNQEEGNGASIPSTGELSQSNQPNETSTNPNQLGNNFDPVEFENNIAATFSGRVDYTMNDEAIDKIADDIKERIIQVQPNIKADYISQVVDKYIDTLKKAFTRVRQYKGIEQAAGNLNIQAQIESGTEALSSRVEESDVTNYSPMFAKAMDTFVDEYIKTLAVPKSEGKSIINMEDILRICQSIFNNDTKQATNLYNMSKEYLLSEEAQKKYIIEDIENVLSDKVVEESRKNIAQIQKEELGDGFSTRIDIQSIIALMSDKNVTDDETRKKYFKTLDSLNVGDKVQLVTTDDELLIRANDVIIGRVPRPNIIDDNTFVMYNEGWKTDVKIDKYGNVQSEFKEFVHDVFWRSNDDTIKALREIISNASLHGITNNYLNQFENNEIINSLIAQSLNEKENFNNRKLFVTKEGNINTKALLTHLVKLYKFTKRGEAATNIKQRNDRLKNNITRWFDKLYNSYSVISNINKTQDVVISDLTEGQLNRKVDKVTKENKKELPYAKDGIKDITNARIAVVNPKNSDEMLVSGKEVLNNSKWNKGSTVIVLYNKNKKPDYVKAIGVDFNGNENDSVKEIGRAISNEIGNLLANFALNGNIDNIEAFFKKLIRYKGINDKDEHKFKYIPILAPKNGTCTITEQHPVNPKRGTTDHSLNINFYDGKSNRYIRFYNLSFGTNSAKIIIGQDGKNTTFDLRDTKQSNSTPISVANTILSVICDLTNINIDSEGINLDNESTSDKQGFITKKDGKIKLDIGDETKGIHKEYNSYNDYIIDNNFVRVNTYIDKDTNSNYTRSSSIQGANQNMYINIPNVENTKEAKSSKGSTETIEKNTNKEQYDKLKESLNSDSNHKGDDLIKLAFGEEFLKDFNAAKEESGIFEDLFPTDIFYDDINYYSDKGVVGSIAQTNSRGNNGNYEHRYKDGRRVTMRIARNKTVIGSRFLNMLASNSPFRKQVAARKLIHERIHQLLGEPTIDRLKVLSSINGIYKEVKQALIDEKKAIDKLDEKDPNYKARIQLYNDVKNTLSYKDGDIALEEFIVESMTNSSVAAFMNNIKVNNAGKATSETLFSKLMKFIAKFFGWDIKKDTLLEKEFNILSNMFEAKPNNESEIKLNEEIKEENHNEDIKQENSPVEGINNEIVSQINQVTDESSNLDFDIGLMSNIEESNIQAINANRNNIEEILSKNDNTNTNSISHFIDRLDEDNKNNMETLIDNGFVSIKCS